MPAASSTPPKRIVIVGGESTGKSTLGAALAKHFGCPLAAEFARDYLTQHGADYDLATSLTLARGQLHRENAAAAEAEANGIPLIITDTDPLTTALWAEYFFNAVNPQVAAMLPTIKHDLHLLCTPDGIPWDDDGLRKSPHSRAWFTQRLLEELSRRHLRHVVLDQPLAQRQARAIEAIHQVLAA